MILTIGNMSLTIDEDYFKGAPFPANRLHDLLCALYGEAEDKIELFSIEFTFDKQQVQRWLSGENEALANNALRLLFIEAYLTQERGEVT